MRNHRRDFVLSRLASAFLVLQLAACAGAPVSSGVRPDWVDSSTAREGRWNRQQYVTAVGSGSSRTQAESAAKRAVAESLRMDVRSKTTREMKSQFTQDTSGRASGSDSEATSGTVDILTDVQLQGVEVAEIYFDQKENSYYGLAILDRMKSRTAAANELMGLKNQVRSRFESYLRRPDAEVGAEIRAMLGEYDRKNQVAAALGNGVPMPGPLTSAELAQLERAEDQALSGRTVTLDFGADGKGLADAAGACLSARRVVVQDRPPADASKHVTVTGSLTATDQQIAVKGFVKVVYDVAASVESASGGLGKIAVTVDASARNRQQAFEKVRQGLGEQVCREVLKRLVQAQ